MKNSVSFGFVNVINKHIGEVIIDDFQILDEHHIQELKETLLPMMQKPFTLIGQTISYSKITPAGLSALAEFKGLIAIAIVKYYRGEDPNIEYLLKNTYQHSINIEKFDGLDMGRSKALIWLEGELQKVQA